jgi:hypothetical protein
VHVGRDEPQCRLVALGQGRRAGGDVDTDDGWAESAHESADVAGRAAADVERDPGRAARGEGAQALGVVRLAGELVGEVGGVLLGDPVEGRPDRVRAQVPTRSVAPRSRSSAIVDR